MKELKIKMEKKQFLESTIRWWNSHPTNAFPQSKQFKTLCEFNLIAVFCSFIQNLKKKKERKSGQKKSFLSFYFNLELREINLK